MRYQYVCATDPTGQNILNVCTARMGESADFFSDLHNREMSGKVIWIQGRTVTVEVEETGGD